MPGLRGIREMLRALLEKYPGMKKRKRLQLTYVAVKRLRERGEEVTLENIVEEARRIIRETRGDIDWGVSPEEYNEAIAAPLLQELIEVGAVEASPELLQEIAKRLRKQKQEDRSIPATSIGLFTRPV